ncbi:hypothetical protein AVEN_82736-1 [Araneus ventricosus]|uniref:Uncharacterized protein n=1 Tax=Araneus ventricosus TaxID=182803 RepID=A0A4Y2ECP6_ARAVE|nr:hypothetical protein AVEN_82736-1 [Araneus ventricosus]
MKAERLREVSGSHKMAAAPLTVTSLAPIGKDRNAHSFLFIPPCPVKLGGFMACGIIAASGKILNCDFMQIGSALFVMSPIDQ